MSEERGNRFHLFDAIVARSMADNWEEAKGEWDLAEIYREDEPLTCLCGHTPIIEVCVLRNRLNAGTAIVGNVCVNRFLGIESERIFEGLRRIHKNPDKGLNAAATLYAFEKVWINKWEKDFSLDTNKKRKLSLKQLAKRDQINRRVLLRTTNTFKSRKPWRKNPNEKRHRE
jgi:hypothetical protein